MKREPKLRPSLAWDEIATAIVALDTCIATAVQTKQVTKQIMHMVKLKEYFETFKPAVSTKSDVEQLAFLMKKFGINAPIEPLVAEAELADNSLTGLPDTPVNKTPLTDDERYDMLKLMGESSYSEDDVAFMNNVGFLIMMRRASKQEVKAGDL